MGKGDAKGRARSRGDARFLPPGFVQHYSDALAATLAPKLRLWGAHGWRIVGVPPRLRVEIMVPRTVRRPKSPVTTVRVAGRSVKPCVRSSHVGTLRELQTNGDEPTAIGLTRAIAPGARIRIGRDDTQEFAGIAAVVLVDGAPHLLTCGHARAFRFSDEVLAADDPDGDPIARLETNLLSGSAPLDAALCKLTGDGASLLAASAGAPTFRFKKVHAPAPADNEQLSIFWETHDGQDDAPTAKVESFSGHTTALFGSNGPQDGFIETGHAVRGGDSGSLVSLGEALYGICSGFVGSTAFFTPISTVLARVQATGKSCSIYSPT